MFSCYWLIISANIMFLFESDGIIVLFLFERDGMIVWFLFENDGIDDRILTFPEKSV